MFNYSGGMGARRTKDGPIGHLLSDRRRRGAGRGAGSLDADRVHKKELRIGSGGNGAIARRRRADHLVAHAHQQHWLLNAVPSRTSLAPEGLAAAATARRARSSSTASACSERAQDRDAGGRSSRAGNAGRRRLRQGGGLALMTTSVPLIPAKAGQSWAMDAGSSAHGGSIHHRTKAGHSARNLLAALSARDQPLQWRLTQGLHVDVSHADNTPQKARRPQLAPRGRTRRAFLAGDRACRALAGADPRPRDSEFPAAGADRRRAG